MKTTADTPQNARADENQKSNRAHRGFIAFCETNLRYEKGVKAWIVLGPYFLGALALEIIGNNRMGWWLGLIAYLVLFPIFWRRLLRFAASLAPNRFRVGAPHACEASRTNLLN